MFKFVSITPTEYFGGRLVISDRSFRAINFPPSAISPYSLTCYQMIRRGRRLTSFPTHNTHKYINRKPSRLYNI